MSRLGLRHLPCNKSIKGGNVSRTPTARSRKEMRFTFAVATVAVASSRNGLPIQAGRLLACAPMPWAQSSRHWQKRRRTAAVDDSATGLVRDPAIPATSPPMLSMLRPTAEVGLVHHGQGN
jgi:hypothetical protein